MRRLFVIITLVTVMFLNSCGKQEDNKEVSPQELAAIVHAFLSVHGLETDVRVVDNIVDRYDAAAITVCQPDGNECIIYFDECVLDAPWSRAADVARHEAAHVANAAINGKFDHGWHWRNLLREQGYRVTEKYSENYMPQCF